MIEDLTTRVEALEAEVADLREQDERQAEVFAGLIATLVTEIQKLKKAKSSTPFVWKKNLA